MEVATAPASKAFRAPGEPVSPRQVMARPSRFGDKAFEWLTCAMALTVLVLVILTGCPDSFRGWSCSNLHASSHHILISLIRFKTRSCTVSGKGA